MAKLSEEKLKDYIGSGGEECPFCGENETQGDGSVQVDGGAATQDISCNICDGQWIDVYTLKSVYLNEVA